MGAGGLGYRGRGRLREVRGFGAGGVGVGVGMGRQAFNDHDADGFLLSEVALYVNDADGEEAGFVVERVPCALVDVDYSVGGKAV